MSSSSNSTIPPDQITPLTDSQEIVLSILSLVSGILSILGSSTIAYKVIHNRLQAKPYDRLLLGLSLCDILASLTYAISPFLLPQDSSQRVWARGTDATCSLLGVLTQFSFSAIVYNGLLSFYYLLTVRFGVKRTTFARRYEPFMHAGVWIFFAATSITGAAIQLYSEFEITQGCWIGEFPPGCEARGDCVGQYIGWVFGGLPFLGTFLVLVVNNLIIYCYVRRALKRHVPPSAVDSTSGASSEAQMADREATRNAQVREVASQGFLYVATFFLAYLPAFCVRVVESLGFDASDEGRLYPLLVLNALFLPLQGLFNLFVYTRPNYVRFKAAYPELGTLVILRRACLDSDIPRLTTTVSKLSSRGTSGRAKPNKSSPRNTHSRRSSSKRSSSPASSLPLSSIEEERSEDLFSDNQFQVPETNKQNKTAEGPLAGGKPDWNVDANVARAMNELQQQQQQLQQQLQQQHQQQPDNEQEDVLDHGNSRNVPVSPSKRHKKTSRRRRRRYDDDQDDVDITMGSQRDSITDTEEALQVFREAASSLRRIGMDGNLYES